MSTYTRWKARLRIRKALLASAERSHHKAIDALETARKAHVHPRQKLVNAERAAEHKVKERQAQVDYAERVVKRHKPKPLRERAYAIAAHEVGVMESGGNNQGTPFTRYQKANGAAGPEAWCGDFQAYCYREAGSKAVQRLWASVWFLGHIAGLHKTSSPKRGDLVRYTFSHVGMFVRDLGNGTIETIEGNTGASGAVSDSRTGGDGVYRKIRSKSLVLDYLRVER